MPSDPLPEVVIFAEEVSWTLPPAPPAPPADAATLEYELPPRPPLPPWLMAMMPARLSDATVIVVLPTVSLMKPPGAPAPPPVEGTPIKAQPMNLMQKL